MRKIIMDDLFRRMDKIRYLYFYKQMSFITQGVAIGLMIVWAFSPQYFNLVSKRLVLICNTLYWYAINRQIQGTGRLKALYNINPMATPWANQITGSYLCPERAI
jgi:hypothetical protein